MFCFSSFFFFFGGKEEYGSFGLIFKKKKKKKGNDTTGTTFECNILSLYVCSSMHTSCYVFLELGKSSTGVERPTHLPRE